MWGGHQSACVHHCHLCYYIQLLTPSYVHIRVTHTHGRGLHAPQVKIPTMVWSMVFPMRFQMRFYPNSGLFVWFCQSPWNLLLTLLAHSISAVTCQYSRRRLWDHRIHYHASYVTSFALAQGWSSKRPQIVAIFCFDISAQKKSAFVATDQ